MSLIRHLAEVIAGLQAPYSVAHHLLGTAGPAWVKVWDDLRLFGWQDADDVETALLERLTWIDTQWAEHRTDKPKGVKDEVV